ncbi:PhzF family phenazine biosynthesis protein [Aquisediminimonas profunda]|uniref:PhzF family phenazine biosynthesis protein n=1 Tax=Aquisediminimonas profunda TaxID=1550733 RepID=UPI001C6311C5|nr:PhzF family phenazine biosynthesis protein [Aquisediminimonas profunda]
MPVQRRFAQVDVFTSKPLFGNPVAVILDAEGLTSEQMQQVALWTNLSETTFVLPATEPGADYHTRIFTPTEELPFAGHPTLGTAHAVIEAGIAAPRDGKLVMQCGAGLVDVSVDGAGLSFRLPRFVPRAASNAEDLAGILGAERLIGDAEVIDTGPHWLVARVDDVAMLSPDAVRLKGHLARDASNGVTAYSETAPGELAVRSFFFTDGLVEDPVCGSGNAAVAAHRIRAGTAGDSDAWFARQGRQIGRDGEIRVRVEQGVVHVGGSCVTVVQGQILI